MFVTVEAAGFKSFRMYVGTFKQPEHLIEAGEAHCEHVPKYLDAIRNERCTHMHNINFHKNMQVEVSEPSQTFYSLGI